MSTADPDDVRGVIATDLSDPDIQSYLDDAEYDAQNAITDYEQTLTTEDKTQLEKYYASLLIRRLRDKPISSASRETASVTYEGTVPTIAELQTAVDKRDPSGTLAYNTDSDRYVNS